MRKIWEEIKYLCKIKIEYIPIAIIMLGLIFEINPYIDNISTSIAVNLTKVFKYTSEPEIKTIITLFSVVIFGPIIEEVFKYSARAFGILQEFLLVICMYEFSFYVFGGLNAGLNIYRLIAVRILCILLHYTTASMIDDGFKNNRKHLCLCFAIIGHSVFNAIGFYESFSGSFPSLIE